MRGGKANRRRGHDFERSVVSLLEALGYQDVCRNLEYQSGKAGHDVEYTGGNGERVRVSCKYGAAVPLTVYGHAIMGGNVAVRTVGDERIMHVPFASGHAWLTKAIGDCDELWAKHPRWPVLRVIGPVSRLK